MTNQEITDASIRRLNAYVFKNVWNEPSKEYRHNLIPKMLGNASVKSNVYVGGQLVSLPDTTNRYYVYVLPLQMFEGIDFTKKVWRKADELLNQDDLLIRFHGPNGEWLHRNKIYTHAMKRSNVFLIAIDSNMYQKILPTTSPTEIYVAPYFDSDAIRKATIHSVKIAVNQDIVNAVAIASTATTTFINGREASNITTFDIKIGDYVESVDDQNVIGSFDIDIALDSPNRVFYSQVSQDMKQIIHIPKAINTNKMISNNTCDVYVRPRNHEGDNLKGLFMHRAQGRAKSFTQLTHNDFAIPCYIINDYCAALGQDEVTLHVVVRDHSKNNVLIRDYNYVDLLYRHSDDQILEFLEGNGRSDLDFWKAVHLEQSEFVKLMWDTPNGIDGENVTRYVDALGYYHIVSVLGQSVYRYILPDVNDKSLTVTLPFIATLIDCVPIVYSNGIKISNSAFTVTYNSIKTKCTIVFDSSFNWVAGSEMIVEFIEDAPDSIEITPDNGTVEHITKNIVFDTTQEDIHVVTEFPPSSIVSCQVTAGPGESGTITIGNRVRNVTDGDFSFISKGDTVIKFQDLTYGDNGPVSIDLSTDLAPYGNVLVVPYTDFDMYEVQVTGTPVKGFEKESTTVYEKIETLPNVLDTMVDNGDGTSTLTFKLGSYGRTFIIRPKNFMYMEEFNLDLDMADENPLVVTLGFGPSNSVYHRDLFDVTSYLVYLNGSELVEGVDYKVVTPIQLMKHSFTQIVVSNYKYLESLNNKLEVIGTNSELQFPQFGYSKNHSINYIPNLPFWYEPISMLFVDGKAIKDAGFEMGELIIPGDGPEVGSIYNIRTLIFKTVKDFVDTYHIDDDMDRYVLLRNYFHEYPETVDDLIVMEDSHEVYSPYLQAVFRDVRRGIIALGYDPVASNMHNQIPQYDYLMAMDPVISVIPDMDYVDIYPAYNDDSLPSPSVTRNFNQLCKGVLPEDRVSDGDIIES